MVDEEREYSVAKALALVEYRVVIVIVNSKCLQRPQKRSRWNQLNHRRLSKIKSIGNGSEPESQTGRQSDGYGGWYLVSADINCRITGSSSRELGTLG